MTKSVLMGEVLHLAFLGSRLKDSARRDYPIVLNNPVYRNGCGKKKKSIAQRRNDISQENVKIGSTII